jgi:lipopolysaccharide biosynthesis glycosyltransferase
METTNNLTSTNINVCFCIDENYVCHLGAVLLSLIDSNKHNSVSIFVLSNGVTEQSKQRLAKTIENIESFTIVFVDSQDKSVNKLKAGGHISSATYIRFEIPSLLTQLDKVFYLDADLVITDDLTEFWNVELENNYVAAVENPFFNRYKSLGIKPEFGYFNAGVLLMNLKRWRASNVQQKAVEFLNTNKAVCEMFDQDALNVVFEGHWKKVPLRWNLQTVYLRRKKDLPELKTEISSAYRTPGIIHYSSSSKPWDFLDPHPKSIVFTQYAEQFGKANKHIKLMNKLRSFIRFLYVRSIYFYQLIL